MAHLSPEDRLPRSGPFADLRFDRFAVNAGRCARNLMLTAELIAAKDRS